MKEIIIMSPLILTPLSLQVSGSTITIIFQELTHASSHMTKSLEDQTTISQQKIR